VKIDEKVHHADDGKNHPPVGVALWIGGVIFHESSGLSSATNDKKGEK
jgi:hypothetical protein